jgi:hypothetical protein
MTVAENDSDKGISKKDIPYFSMAAIAVIVSIFALLFTPVVFDRIFPGEVRPLPPSGFFVVRGIYVHNSDHIVFPIDWENTGAKATLIMHPKLILRELDDNCYETGNESIFPMAGEYQEVSDKIFREELYNLKESLIIAPRTITPTMMVFHVEDFWNYTNETSQNFSFFSEKKDKNYSVYIKFNRELEPIPEVVLIKHMNIPDYVDNLTYNNAKGWYNWEWFRIENQTVH